MLRGEEYIKRIVENMDYLNRGKEFKYIDVREGRKVINTGKNKPTVHPPQTNKQTDKQTNILHLYIIE